MRLSADNRVQGKNRLAREECETRFAIVLREGVIQLNHQFAPRSIRRSVTSPTRITAIPLL